ncbi:EAL domain-containing protein [Lysinibacillus sp. FJAT-14222]|uniref:EAL domain-containing protein n=1 Tax=Lysinibacillus sp. FJAT-14222 TaxID=1932366 RepID=UPI0006AEE58C|nr:EAL domain-containing protein [Lysinibacillus sp. FJAT-14222]KOS64098.1 hypothetical protein AN161_04295 [Lysinibacillus sp. FJAT-14222]
MFRDVAKVEHTLRLLEGAFSVFVTDIKGTITYINNHFCEISKCNKSELIGQSYKKMNVQFDFHKEQHIRTIFAGEVWRGEVRYQTRDNKEYWFYLVITPINNNEGDIYQFLAVGNDITNHKKLELSLNETLKNLHDIKNALDEASIVAITDEKGVITYVNEKFCEISKYKNEELIGKTHRVINSKFHPKSFFKTMWETIRQGKTWNGEVKNRAKDGSEYWMNTTIVPFLDSEGKPYQYISIRTDITDRIKAETALAKALESDFRKVVQNLQNCVFKIVDHEDTKIVFTLCEGKIAEELGLVTDAIRGKTSFEIFGSDVATQLELNFHKAFNGETINFELPYYNRFFYITLSPIWENGKIVEVIGSMMDITERKKAEETIHHMAHHDSLTNLANRRLFTQLLNSAVLKAGENQESLCVMFIDLDRFKNINDTLGHLIGDALLQSVADRLLSCLRDNDVVSRQGGDEFTLFLSNISRKEAGAVARRIIKTISKTLTLEHLELYITPSIGISMYPDDGDTVEKLIKHADAAMYLAKDYGKNNYQFYTKELQQAMLKKLKLETDLRKAQEKNQLMLYYQPKINITTGKIIGTEALIRWNHPKLGIVSPDQFIPLAEETGLIVPIGEWVIRTACKQAKIWQDEGQPNLTVAVNISLRQFMQNNLHEVIGEILEETSLAPEYLELEITESMASDVDYTIRALKRIKSLGVSISIDDFGTGYSSLSYLSKFPIDRLKIDQSFVRNLNLSNRAIIKSIIDIAHNLNIEVIAEGVETEEHANFLREQMCKEAQGYYFSKPLPSHEVDKILMTELKDA